jgi:hypothetical protein
MPRKKARNPEVHNDPAKRKGTLKSVGGSISDHWNNLVANQTVRALWHFESADPETKKRDRSATINALVGISPRDECEGMIAAQLIACHHAAMECYGARCFLSNHSKAGGSNSIRQINCRGHMQHCWKL